MIGYTNWQLATSGLGNIVIGANDISQAILLVIATRKGSDPFRPTFGSEVFEFIDQPITVAGPGIVKEIIMAVGIWETRIQIQKVTYSLFEQDGDLPGIYSGMRFEIGWLSSDGTIEGNTNLLIASETAGGSGISITLLTDDSGIPLSSDGGQILTI